MDSEESSSMLVNNEGCYTSYCVELEIDALPVTTLLQSHHIHDIEGSFVYKYIFIQGYYF